MNTPDNTNGKIDSCADCSHICGYGCCHQSLPHELDFGPESSLLICPGEVEDVTADVRTHIIITTEDFHGGKLGYCDRDNFDQSSCNPERNFKPLDCQSYPFFPTFVDGNLVLVVDSKRCPLPTRSLFAHHDKVLRLWRNLVEKKPEISLWIQQLNLQGYQPFNR